MPQKTINIFDDLFKNLWKSIIVIEFRSKWFAQLIGLDQGRPLSPLLNLLFFDPIYHCVDPSLCVLSLYVDDIALISKLTKNFILNTQKQIQTQFYKLNQWLQHNHTELSVRKTKYVIFSNNHY